MGDGGHAAFASIMWSPPLEAKVGNNNNNDNINDDDDDDDGWKRPNAIPATAGTVFVDAVLCPNEVVRVRNQSRCVLQFFVTAVTLIVLPLAMRTKPSFQQE
mmetsp:Transcript_28313/g.66495  ORF Transcript_28313/g.66495 Transcript_28313/m.66495 type:complete len:102 (-) Transcript_28313:345-650(-)